jgi:hypothetical protein
MQRWYCQEPAWAHVTPVVTREGRRDEQLRDAARSIVGPLSGVDKDTIDSEDQREARLARRTLRGLLVGLSVLLAFAPVAAGIAFTELNIANQRERRVTAQLLLSQAQATLSAEPRTALQMAEAAYRLDPTTEADDTIVQLLANTRYSGALTGHTEFILGEAFSPRWTHPGHGQRRLDGDPLGHAGPGQATTLRFPPRSHRPRDRGGLLTRWQHPGHRHL